MMVLVEEAEEIEIGQEIGKGTGTEVRIEKDQEIDLGTKIGKRIDLENETGPEIDREIGKKIETETEIETDLEIGIGIGTEMVYLTLEDPVLEIVMVEITLLQGGEIMKILGI